MTNNTDLVLQKLPTLQELHMAPEDAFKHDALNTLLNNEPPTAWVKTNVYAGNTKYIPIEKVEFLLTRIFQRWRVEVKSYCQLFNAVTVCVRVHYLNPVSGEWEYHDGVGAVGIQTDAGKPAADLSSIKQAAVMMALPAAKSYAIKDAAEHLGKFFGRDLNRKETIAFSGAYMEPDKNLLEEALIEIKKFTDSDQLVEWANDKLHLRASKEFQEAVQKHLKTL